jgi:hydrogenase nickel incorporation protein HypB
MRTSCIGHCTSCPLTGLDLLFIENVGNLVCPASFDLGQHRNVTLLSVTEGDDKPAKYPVIFRASDLVVLSKADLLDVLDDFDPARAAAALARARPRHADDYYGRAAHAGA